MNRITRRRLLQGAMSAAAASYIHSARAAEQPLSPKRQDCTFSFGTYGMKTLSVEEGIRIIADVGYDGVEICARPEYDSAPSRMPSERRRAVRELLERRGLRVTALMEFLFPAKDDAQHAADLERLRDVVALGHDLSPNRVPLVQTVLGDGDWEQCKERFRDRLAGWIEVGKEGGAVIAIKPHRGGVMSRPEEAIWLIHQLGDTPWLRMVYDYSHYAFRDMPVEDTVKTALPYVAHVAVKDAVQEGAKVVFKLPGESGTFDYARLFRLLYEGDYRGDICCEVSGMISGKPGYDPVAAAKTCYANLAPLFERAGVPRPAKRAT